MTSDDSRPLSPPLPLPRQEVPGEAALAPVLAYLITAARTQVDEAPEYGPFRLLTAASRLAAALAPTASPELAELIAQIEAVSPTVTPAAGIDEYRRVLDGLCTALADYLLAASAKDEA